MIISRFIHAVVNGIISFFLWLSSISLCVCVCVCVCVYTYIYIHIHGASQVALGVKNSPANAGGIRNVDLIPGWGRSPGGGHGNPLQYSCLENPMGRGPWRAMVHKFTKTQTQLSWHCTGTSNASFKMF